MPLAGADEADEHDAAGSLDGSEGLLDRGGGGGEHDGGIDAA